MTSPTASCLASLRQGTISSFWIVSRCHDSPAPGILTAMKRHPDRPAPIFCTIIGPTSGTPQATAPGVFGWRINSS